MPEIMTINASNKLLRVVRSMIMMENVYSAWSCMKISMINVFEIKLGASSPSG